MAFSVSMDAVLGSIEYSSGELQKCSLVAAGCRSGYSAVVLLPVCTRSALHKPPSSLDLPYSTRQFKPGQPSPALCDQHRIDRAFVTARGRWTYAALLWLDRARPM